MPEEKEPYKKIDYIGSTRVMGVMIGRTNGFKKVLFFVDSDFKILCP